MGKILGADQMKIEDAIKSSPKPSRIYRKNWEYHFFNLHDFRGTDVLADDWRVNNKTEENTNERNRNGKKNRSKQRRD